MVTIGSGRSTRRRYVAHGASFIEATFVTCSRSANSSNVALPSLFFGNDKCGCCPPPPTRAPSPPPPSSPSTDNDGGAAVRPIFGRTTSSRV